MRGLLVYIIASVIILGAFLIFALAGWPGEPSSCTQSDPDGCFCEAFDLEDVKQNRPGIRQWTNTLSNLYSLGTALVIVLFLKHDRKTFAGRTAPNIMKSSSWIADLYLFAVLFLGLGSMWFHASITGWGSIFDGLSMYIYTGFLVFYTMIRLYGDRVIFWIGYPTIVIVMTFFHATGVPSFALILILVTLYLLFEFRLWSKERAFAMGKLKPILLWCGAVLSMIAATIFWEFSKSGKSLCDPDSAFQAHGLLWHTLAGLMALLLYFCWREDDASDPVHYDRRGGPPYNA